MQSKSLINILIRTHNRKELFLRCLKSVTDQSYSNVRVIVSIDCECDYIPDWCDVITVSPGTQEYYYDCYLNDLKALVSEGWFFALDDDDILCHGALSALILDAPAILVQINHMGRILPPSANFGFGQVGNPCLVLHHSLKDLVYYTGGDHGDCHYINEVRSKVALKFQELVLVECDRKGFGK